MREAKSGFDLRVGMRVIVENYPELLEKGITEVRGEIKHVDAERSNFSFVCDQTNNRELVTLGQGKVWILD